MGLVVVPLALWVGIMFKHRSRKWSEERGWGRTAGEWWWYWGRRKWKWLSLLSVTIPLLWRSCQIISYSEYERQSRRLLTWTWKMKWSWLKSSSTHLLNISSFVKTINVGFQRFDSNCQADLDLCLNISFRSQIYRLSKFPWFCMLCWLAVVLVDELNVVGSEV